MCIFETVTFIFLSFICNFQKTKIFTKKTQIFSCILKSFYKLMNEEGKKKGKVVMLKKLQFVLIMKQRKIKIEYFRK